VIDYHDIDCILAALEFQTELIAQRSDGHRNAVRLVAGEE
jgi:hypothetical protein